MKPDDQYVHCAAYHEAAHIVVAAVLGLPLLGRGLYVNDRGAGFAAYRGARPSGRTNVGPDAEIERTIIATNAGHIAHGVCYEAAASGDANASDDFELIQALLREMYSDQALRDAAQRELLREAKELVAQYWAAITDIAEALWAESWVPAKQGREKHLEGTDVLTILGRWQIEAVLVEGE